MAEYQAIAEFLEEWGPADNQLHHQLVELDDLLLENHLLSATDTMEDFQVGSDDGLRTTITRRKRERQEKVDNGAQRRLQYRQKVKAERSALKQQAIDLSNALSRLQTQQARRKKLACNPSFSMWKAIATRELGLRRKSEKEQNRLSADAMNQALLIREMNTVLASRNLSDSQVLCSTKTLQSGMAMMKAFAEELDEIYAQMDHAMRGVESTASSLSTYTLTWKQFQGIDLLEFSTATDVPLELDRICDAFAALVRKSASANDTDVDDSDSNTFGVKYSGFRHAEHDSANMVGYGAMKKFHESERRVFVYRTLFEGHGEFDGLLLHETMWLIVSAKGDNSTRLELYGRFLPGQVNSSAGTTATTTPFVNAVTKLVEDGNNEMMRMLDMLAKK